MRARPNIVFILADDMGYGDLSCLNDKSKIHTHYIDRMAAEGVIFTDAHASSSVCTPSRYGILTGRYAWRGSLQRGVLWPFARPLIEKDLLTLPQFLKKQGYQTACIGKWHLGMAWPFNNPQNTDSLRPHDSEEIIAVDADIDYTKPIENGPLSYGFDYYFGVDVPNFPPYCFIENDHTLGTPDRLKPDTMFGCSGRMIEGWDLENIMPALTARAVEYIEDKADSQEPFFLYFPLTAPHTPIAPVEEFQGKSGAGIYGDFCLQIDDTVSQINAALKRSGLEENTLVIFTSDNGSPGRNGDRENPGTVLETYAHNPSWILRGMKADTWDGGHRIPYIAKWPARIAKGSICSQLVCLMDLMATCADITGQKLPAGSAGDSLSILPYLLSSDLKVPVREYLVHHGYNGLYGIRKGEWKLITGTGSGGFSPDPETTIYDPPGQLYNMAEDIREQKNLYFQRPDIVNDLTKLMLQVRY